MRLRFVGILIVAVALSGCGRVANYLNYIGDRAPQKTYDVLHKVKELQGNSKAEILWVIDNSGSMYNWQQMVIRNTDLFMQGFTKKTGLNWRMGLISTDESEQPYIGMTPANLLDRSTANPIAAFQGAVRRLGTNGSATEKMFSPVMRALTEHPSFSRPDSVLILIVVTDAPEQSYSVSAKDFLSFLSTAKGDLRRVITYGILGPQDWGCQQTDEEWEFAGSKYEELITATNGKGFKICSPDFGKNLEDIGEDLAKRVAQPRFLLASRPVLSTLRISYLDKVLPGGPKADGGFWIYDYDANAIVFHDLDFAPTENEQVRITYSEDDGRPLTP